ncbi:hypothetical protein Bca52824_059845 [Brassica carinata]|uniref:Uncharacterized protein n=1 Tax=Brassica carinata TaxID=52824 RepID=A0A8X7UF29_BRACI|nr:hypothetical protein Bca52824_059845 [Brassica carinata]
MKFVVFLIFVGVVCANVDARQLEEVSKKTKLGICIPKTVTTNGIGAELSRVYEKYYIDNLTALELSLAEFMRIYA